MSSFLRLSSTRIYVMCNDNDEDYGEEYSWWDDYEASLDEQGGKYL